MLIFSTEDLVCFSCILLHHDILSLEELLELLGVLHKAFLYNLIITFVNGTIDKISNR